MISEELQQELLNCLISQNPAMQNAISLAANYTNMVNNHQLSVSEYQELLQDIHRSVNIYEAMVDLSVKEQFNTVINKLINTVTSV